MHIFLENIQAYYIIAGRKITIYHVFFKVVSQREQVLVVPMMHLEDVRKNITETVTAETDVDGLTLTNIQSFTENGEKGNTVKHEKFNDQTQIN